MANDYVYKQSFAPFTVDQKCVWQTCFVMSEIRLKAIKMAQPKRARFNSTSKNYDMLLGLSLCKPQGAQNHNRNPQRQKYNDLLLYGIFGSWIKCQNSLKPLKCSYLNEIMSICCFLVALWLLSSILTEKPKLAKMLFRSHKAFKKQQINII